MKKFLRIIRKEIDVECKQRKLKIYLSEGKSHRKVSWCCFFMLRMKVMVVPFQVVYGYLTALKCFSIILICIFDGRLGYYVGTELNRVDYSSLGLPFAGFNDETF